MTDDKLTDRPGEDAYVTVGDKEGEHAEGEYVGGVLDLDGEEAAEELAEEYQAANLLASKRGLAIAQKLRNAYAKEAEAIVKAGKKVPAKDKKGPVGDFIKAVELLKGGGEPSPSQEILLKDPMNIAAFKQEKLQQGDAPPSTSMQKLVARVEKVMPQLATVQKAAEGPAGTGV